MKIFIDTANVEEIIPANDMGVICGVTTNPSLVAKEGRDFKEVIKEITIIVDGSISAEVISLKCNEMINEGPELAKIHPNIVIKVPITIDGLKAVNTSSSRGIKTDVTLVSSTAQALLAARAGTTYVSPFIGRVDDIGSKGIEPVKEIASVFKIHHTNAEVIAASARDPIHSIEATLAGAHITIIPYNILVQMTKNPLIDMRIERFLSDWNNSNEK